MINRSTRGLFSSAVVAKQMNLLFQVIFPLYVGSCILYILIRYTSRLCPSRHHTVLLLPGGQQGNGRTEEDGEEQEQFTLNILDHQHQ